MTEEDILAVIGKPWNVNLIQLLEEMVGSAKDDLHMTGASENWGSQCGKGRIAEH